MCVLMPNVELFDVLCLSLNAERGRRLCPCNELSDSLGSLLHRSAHITNKLQHHKSSTQRQDEAAQQHPNTHLRAYIVRGIMLVFIVLCLFVGVAWLCVVLTLLAVLSSSQPRESGSLSAALLAWGKRQPAKPTLR